MDQTLTTEKEYQVFLTDKEINFVTLLLMGLNDFINDVPSVIKIKINIDDLVYKFNKSRQNEDD